MVLWQLYNPSYGSDVSRFFRKRGWQHKEKLKLNTQSAKISKLFYLVPKLYHMKRKCKLCANYFRGKELNSWLALLDISFDHWFELIFYFFMDARHHFLFLFFYHFPRSHDTVHSGQIFISLYIDLVSLTQVMAKTTRNALKEKRMKVWN